MNFECFEINITMRIYLSSLLFFFLAETAQIIVRCVNYEIPAIKKNIARCLQTQKVKVISCQRSIINRHCTLSCIIGWT